MTDRQPSIPFNHDYEFEYATVQTVDPAIRRVVARNPGPYTFHGTGTYIVGHGEVAVIDPGPAIAEHVEALLAAVAGERITHILVTHTHLDHSPAAAAVKATTGAPTYGFGPHGRGRFLEGERVEEGADFAFEPDVVVADGDVIDGPGWSFECVHTPGHTSNHLCFQYREARALFSGDHVMGWSTSVISPPDGDMGDYLTSLERLLDRDDRRYWPTHGPSIEDPHPYVRAFLAHRAHREEQIVECIRLGAGRIEDMVRRMYPHLDPVLHSAAARQVFSAILNLIDKGQVHCAGEPSMTAAYLLG